MFFSDMLFVFLSSLKSVGISCGAWFLFTFDLNWLGFSFCTREALFNWVVSFSSIGKPSSGMGCVFRHTIHLNSFSTLISVASTQKVHKEWPQGSRRGRLNLSRHLGHFKSSSIVSLSLSSERTISSKKSEKHFYELTKKISKNFWFLSLN